MIDIGVTGLVKSFDLEKKILDGLTFQIDTGERVGILGRNGAGKTTLFKILTGELDYDEGEVFIAPGKRLGLISQIPVYPAEYTVEDVLRTAFSRMERLKGEMDALAEKMAAGDSSAATLKRYGDLSSAPCVNRAQRSPPRRITRRSRCTPSRPRELRTPPVNST